MTTEPLKILPLMSLAHSAATGIFSRALFGNSSSKSLAMKSCFEYSSYPSMTIKTSAGWPTMYSNKESSIFEWSSNTDDRFRTPLKLTGVSLSKSSWRKVSKYANFKSGMFVPEGNWNNLPSAQSRINFWQKRVLPMPAFPVRRMDWGFFSLPSAEVNISWQCLTGFPLIWPYWRRCFFLSMLWSSTGFLPCWMRTFVKMSSVLTFFLVWEARRQNSVWLIIDSFNAFVYAVTAEKRIQSLS